MATFEFIVSLTILTPSGLPQGAVLSITLFAIYISDMPHPPHTQLALYADDTALLTQSWRTDTIVRRLNHAMTVLHRYFTQWKLQVNITKTAAILFTKRRPPPPPSLRFRLTHIPWSPHIRYLGLQLDSKLLFTKHLNTVTHKAMGVLLALFPLLARDSTLALAQQTHSLQITDSSHSHIRRPSLEQYFNHQLSSPPNSPVEMSSGHR